MSRSFSFRFRGLSTVAALALAAGLAGAVPTPAAADTTPEPGTPQTVSADALPTAQINGVAWSQAVVGNTVYVGGRFSNVRPAGAAAGVDTTTRNNLMAYDIRTGANIASFAPDLNGQVLAVAATPDGSKIYVGGDFTAANGQTRSRIAAYSTATGQLLSSFRPAAQTQVRALAATNSTVYLGGNFQTVAGVARRYVAAVDATTGAVRPWDPSADAPVNAIALNNSGSKVVLGGRFQYLRDQATYGLGAVDPTTGAKVSWEVSNDVRNAGKDAAVLSLTSDADGVYGTAYHFGPGGNLEGTFRADNETGRTIWIEDCHGDTYSSFPTSELVYTASHKHHCGNIGSFPETNPRTHHFAQAFTKQVTGTITHDTQGYFDWFGYPRPTYTHWDPTFKAGTATGQNQAGWSVTGSGDYIAYAGEFPTVNGASQQGLVRFAKPNIAPNKRGPASNEGLTPAVLPVSSSAVRVAWQTTFDQDNESLTYKVFRNFKNLNDTPVCTITAKSSFWQRPQVGCFDRTVTAGARYNYRVYAFDPFGNQASRAATTITVPTSTQTSAYASAVQADEPTSYYRLGESDGTAVYDSVAFNDAAAQAGVSRGAVGATGDGDTASTFNGTDTGYAVTGDTVTGPDTFSVEGWFRTSSTSGGKIVGFGNAKTGQSSSYDRHVYLDNDGRVWFGVYPGGVRTVNSSSGFNDGQWHQFTASMGSNGMTLYLDGKRVASRADTTTGQPYTGQWRIGGDNIGGWPNQPRSNFLAGDIDDVAVYDKVLTSAAVSNHYVASGRTQPGSSAPADAYGAAVYAQDPDLYWRLDESTGQVAADSGPMQNPGRIVSGVALGRDGALKGQTRTAGGFNGSDGHVVATTPTSNPSTYSAMVWFKTATNRGGKLIGFGNATSGTSSNYDRHVYMQDDGRLVFGTYTGQLNTITTQNALNDNRWHQVVATQSNQGLRLYVDGELAGTNPQTQAQGYDGYWRIGGDNTWGSSSAFFDGTLDEAAVFGSALSAGTVKSIYDLGAGTTPPPPANVKPTGAFSFTTEALKATFDSTESKDSDGSIASWSWNFGDGGTSTQQNPVHDYAQPGTYAVTLTVTDNQGLTDQVSKDVTVARVNLKPTAAFTSSTDGLKATFDSTASMDPDGTIASRSWTFGDGSTSTEENPVRTYAQPGTYAVTLTVTDNQGLTDQVSQNVTVTVAPPADNALARDAFARTLTTGWGTADQGGSWTLNGSASRFEVSSGRGLMKVPAGSTPGAYLNGVSSGDTDTTVDISFDQAITGGGVSTFVTGRGGVGNSYRARLKIAANGALNLAVTRVVNGSETAVGATNVTDLTYASGDTLRMRFQVCGSGTSSLRAKVWKAGSQEPSAWRVSANDSTSVLQNVKGVGLTSFLSGSATAALAFRYSNLVVMSPN